MGMSAILTDPPELSSAERRATRLFAAVTHKRLAARNARHQERLPSAPP